MKSALNQNGMIFITFGPPWLAPYGSHTQFFTPLPWVNILFSENTVMRVRNNFRNDGAKRYADAEGGLNKMTISGFERIIARSCMKMQYRRYDSLKRLNLLGHLPIVRELFINQVNCILRKESE